MDKISWFRKGAPERWGTQNNSKINREKNKENRFKGIKNSQDWMASPDANRGCSRLAGDLSKDHSKWTGSEIKDSVSGQALAHGTACGVPY